MKEIFTKIYKTNYWAGRQSRSGTGSDLEETHKLRNALPALFSILDVKSVLDIPCGDLNWYAKTVFRKHEYIGADIVPELIEANKDRYPVLDFRVLDITKDELPKVDLIFTRDCLGHLSEEHIYQAVDNVLRAKPKYFVATHWPRARKKEIADGGWMPINMEHYLDGNFELIDTIEEDITGKTLGVWEILDGFSRSIY